MNALIIQQLLDLNREFYKSLAVPFADSREHYQEGYQRLLSYLPDPCEQVLDIGCGEGRFGRFLFAHEAIENYVGVDWSTELLAVARQKTPGTYWQRDISRPGFLAGLGDYPVIACLSTLQHIPGEQNRLDLLQEMTAHLQPAGIIILANWQFSANFRQQRKITPWSTIGISADEVEPGDYLLSWQRGGSGLRYVNEITLDSTRRLADAASLHLIAHFRSDGREGNLNLYTVWRRH